MNWQDKRYILNAVILTLFLVVTFLVLIRPIEVQSRVGVMIDREVTSQIKAIEEKFRSHFKAIEEKFGSHYHEGLKRKVVYDDTKEGQER